MLNDQATSACPGCGASAAAGRFCRHCGASLQPQQPPAQPPPSVHPYPPPYPPPPHQHPAAQQQESRTLAVVLATTLTIVLLGAAAAVILLVANDGSGRSGVLTQSTLPGPAGQSPASSP